MSECILCGKPTGFLDKRNVEGYLCKACTSCIPTVIDIASCSTEKLKYFKVSHLKKKALFQSTASFGIVYLDSVHQLFCISRTHRKDSPASFSDLFAVSELEEIALDCTNPICHGNGRNISVTCDVELYFRTQELHYRTIIYHNAVCSCKEVDGHKVDWKEAGIVSMFRSMFQQMISNEQNAVLKEINAVRNLQSIVYAEGMLMLKQQYTLDELQHHYEFLKHHLQYGVNPEENCYYEKLLDEAYLLLKHHKQRES